jgi:8-oxo-dGTP diphosphatase
MGAGRIIHVVAGVIRNNDGEILTTLRHDHLHQGGLWEFPGGKLEVDESRLNGLKRELSEELAIEVQAATPLIQVPHHYEDRSVLLDIWEVTQFSGDPQGAEGQQLRWSKIDALTAKEFPAADRPVLTALQLPDRYLITGKAEGRDDFLQKLERVLEQGIQLVQFRAPELEQEPYLELARAVIEKAHGYNARVLLNGDPAWVSQVGADGIHLNGHRLKELSGRPFEENLLVSASLHNADEIQRAADIGVDFAVLSAVLPTKTHPDREPLGWDYFAELVAAAPYPVYALGGVDQKHIQQARERGGHGVAAIRAFWN